MTRLVTLEVYSGRKQQPIGGFIVFSGNKQELYLDICHEFIVKRFGKEPGRGRVPGRSFMTATMVTPEEGGTVRRFNEADLSWDDTGQDFTNWSIVSDGKVFVSYPEDDPEDGGMFFKVAHPREVSELLCLLVQPFVEAPLASAMPPSRQLNLGDLVDMHVLIPMGDGWRALALALPPSTMPQGLPEALGSNMVQNWDSLVSGKSCEAGKFADRWPDFIGSLPDAAPLLRAGYLAKKHLNLHHALDLLAEGPRGNGPFLNMLLVPSREDVSSLYLREYLNGDFEAAKQREGAFAEENDLGKVHAGLKNVAIRMPAAFVDQIQLAAQVNLMRQRVLQQAECLANWRATFEELIIRYRDAGQAINELIADNRS
jgi:hypothetical protein